MSVSPWPTEDIDSVLFVLDAAHRVEQQHLEEWLERERVKRPYSGEVAFVVVPIAGSPERISTRTLLPALKMPPAFVLSGSKRSM